MNFPPGNKDWMNTGKEMYLQDLFEIQQIQSPDAIAVYFEGKELSYSALNRQANLLVNKILTHSSQSSIVGICTTRSIEMIAGVLAILKSGKTYMPLDPNYPADRLQQMIIDSGIQICLADQSEFPLFESLHTQIQLIALDGQINTVVDLKPENFSSLAYVLYTSGSTGKPKGVSMGHSPLVNLLQWQKKNSIAGKGTNTLQFAPLSFDVSFQEIFATLTTGGTLVLVGDDLRMDPQNLLRFLEEKSIQRIFLPFVALQFLTEAADAIQLYPACLQEVITAGEQLKVTRQLVRFFSALSTCTLFNQYGPTECHVVTALKMEGDPTSWPALPAIGKPIDNTQIFILDEKGNLLPPGETGELCISGKSLAEGYLNRPEMTAEKFTYLDDPVRGNMRIYKTGDLARFKPDGNIELLGRRDEQVKIRGYRIEPGEIEVLLNRQPGIQQAVVIAREDIPGQKRLVAYLVSSDGLKDTTTLRHSVDRLLPDYMMPSAFVWMNGLPKTSSGKLDKKLLPKPEIKRPDLSVLYKEPVTKIEKAIADCWISILQLDKVGLDDNFFELGGNSLLALKTVAQLKQTIRLNLPITKLYQHPSISGIAAFHEGKVEITKSFFKKNQPTGHGSDIAVIAMAGRFPGANTIDALWNLLLEGRETISFFSKEELDPYITDELKNNPDYVRARGIIDKADEFDASFFGINPRLAELMDPQQRIFMEIAWEALESGGYFPSAYKGSIGVFAGTGNNTYFYHNVQDHKEKIELVGSFQVMTANEKDYIASRTAYELNLKGPAVSIHSACSTSLLAIAEAVESIRKGQCDIALAGGVAITIPVKSGHIYQEGAMYSSDGHCRSFDADAEGTVFSDGAGVVLLKRLDDAIRDGDTVYSVIRGIGINNDGGGKGSFTAPSAEGQAGAIHMAIHDAGIDPANISYIETHGTATPLGDPIEIEGLNLAFGPQKKMQYCAIGSIKSNIGHLTAASGVAGLIKTTLALYHKKIPASINFKKPNPHIDFAKSPFYVNDHLTDWNPQSSRIAGVSSFGVGGTNVHVILEENINSVPEAKSSGQNPQRAIQLINWSAKTAKSREAFAEKLSTCIRKNNLLNTADLAYTLQTKREHFKARRFLIAGDREELIHKLEQASGSTEDTKILEEKSTDVVFLFPGQGSQHLNMGKALYDSEPVFRNAVDECAAMLLPFMKEDLRDIIYPAIITAEAEGKIHNTYYTQPALFVIEYATARLWMSWGIKPAAFIGHSIGEFVAAHLAGIFSLSDGLRLIFYRGKLMSSLPRGNMLGVRSGYEKIEPLLPAGISLAAINSPGLCVVSGPEQDIRDFSKLLTSQNIANKLLQTSHAFHSSMMDPILSSFEEVAESISFSVPRIPIVSTLTGKWMTDTEVARPAYWSKQLRSPVRFSEAVTTLSEQGFGLALESGPGRVLSTLARQQGIQNPIVTIPSLDPEEGKSELHSILKALGQLWLNGMDPDWESFYREQKRKRITLPGYAFDRVRYWVDPVLLPRKSTDLTPHLNGKTAENQKESIAENNLPKKDIMRKEILIKKLKVMLENASGIEMESADPETNFIEIGFDSLLLTQVALNLKKEFGLPVSFRQLNEAYGSLDLLAAYLDENLPKDKYQETAITPVVNNTSVQMEEIATASTAPSAIEMITKQIQMLAQQVAQLQQVNPSSAIQSKPVEVKKENIQGLNSEVLKDLSADEISELKKPFGATARIEKHLTALNSHQQAFLDALTLRYNQKTRLSKAFTQKHRSYMADPRVVSGFKPHTKEIVYSIVVNKSKGCRLWDIDGNEYIDALNGFGSNFLGYQPEIIVKAVKEQIENGYELGPQHELAGIVCKLLCEFTGFERSALCNTGSEAVLGAMRIARTVTGRSTIVAFSGSYHGILDEVIVRGTKKLKTFPAAPGIMPEAVQNMLILDYGTEESLAIIRERANDLAAVLVEPVQSRRPEFQPVEFLKALRKITAESGTALIFDEVITGFRMHPRGTQGMFGIQADLGTYGKVVAGGMPIGVIAGNKLFMDALDGGYWEFGDASTPDSGVTYFAGTFVRHPLALAAAKASLEYMKAKGPRLQEDLNALTQVLADGLNRVCSLNGIPVYVAHFGSLWKIKTKEEIPYFELLFTGMREKGIHIWDGFPCFLTEAHQLSEVNQIIEKFEVTVNELIAAGFMRSSKAGAEIQEKYSSEQKPPVAGAKLGRDKEGNPAWFILDPSRPGKYLQVN